jgi:hypothetical protein
MAKKDSASRHESENLAPDPATSYERAKPEREAGMGRLDNNRGTPTNSPDRMEQAVTPRQPSRQLNADDVVNAKEQSQADGSRTRIGRPRADGADIKNE